MLGLAVLVTLSVPAISQSNTYIRKVDVTPLVTEVRAAGAEFGADADNRNLNLAIGLMTSHFGADPSHAEGMRRIAREFVRRFSAVGDYVVVAGWEMGVWTISERARMDDTCADRRARLVGRMLPTAPKNLSRGGHDTEQAIATLWESVADMANERDTVLVLLATEEASMVPTGSRGVNLLGLNAAEYQAVMAKARRRPGIRVTFEARAQPTGGNWKTRTATALVVVPRTFRPGGEAVGRGASKGCDVPPRWPLLLAGLAGLAALAGLVFGVAKIRLRVGHRKASPTTATVGDRTFALEGINESEWLLHGIGASADGANDVIMDTVSGEAPPRLLAKLSFARDRGLQLRPEAMISAVTVDGMVLQDDARIQPGDHVLEMKGQYAEDPDMLPDRFVVRVNIHVE